MSVSRAAVSSFARSAVASLVKSLAGAVEGGGPSCDITIGNAFAGAFSLLAASIDGQRFYVTSAAGTTGYVAGILSHAGVGGWAVECIDTDTDIGTGGALTYMIQSADFAKQLQAYWNTDGAWNFVILNGATPVGTGAVIAAKTAVIGLGVDQSTGAVIACVDGTPVSISGAPSTHFAGKTDFNLLGLITPASAGNTGTGTFRTTVSDFAHSYAGQTHDWCGNAL